MKPPVPCIVRGEDLVVSAGICFGGAVRRADRGPPASPFRVSPVPTLRRLAPEANIPARPVAFAITTTLHPAHIPPEVAGSSRRYPSIPARWRTKDPLSPRNPRLSPLTPGGAMTGLSRRRSRVESRRSRLSSTNPCKLACSVVHPGLNDRRPLVHPAHILHGNPRPTPPDADNPRNLEAGPIAGGRSPGGQSRSQPVAFTTSVGLDI